MDELSEVKKCIRSLLTANSLVSTIESLQKDYHSLIGIRIPAAKFGYQNVEQFLKSISDTCLVMGHGPFATVTPVVTEKCAHINEMVMRQKAPSTKRGRKHKPQRPRNYVMPRSQTNRFSNSSHSDGERYFQKDNFTVSQQHKIANTDVSSSNRECFIGKNLPVKNNEVSSIKPDSSIYNVTPSKPNTPVVNKNPSPILNNIISNVCDIRPNNKPVQNTLTELALKQKDEHSLEQEKYLRTQQYVAGTLSSNSNISNEYCDNSDNLFYNMDKGHNVFPKIIKPVVEQDNEVSSSTVPAKIKENLLKIIGRFPNGIWCANLPSEYRKEFQKDLKFTNYGYSSLIQMCMSLKDVFHYVRPDSGDFKLYDARKPFPKVLLRPTCVSARSTCKEGDTKEALPSLDWTDYEGHIPHDVLKVNEEVPQEFLPGVKVGDVININVAEIYDPSKFWFTMGDSKLDDLMDAMQVFYKNETNRRQYSMPKSLMKVGVLCVQVIYKEYHRAIIISDLNEETQTVKLYFIDYGSVTTYSVKGMCFLKKQFAKLPIQAIRCRLADIAPLYEDVPWSLESRYRLKSLAEGKDTKLQVTHLSAEEQVVSGFLFDTSDMQNIIYINEQLVTDGHAQWLNQDQLIQPVSCNYILDVLENPIYLYPTFDELEKGLTPTLCEIEQLQPFNVTFDLLFPKYYKLKHNVNEAKIAANLESHFQRLKSLVRRRPITTQFLVGPSDNNKSFDFDVFGDMKEEMQKFYRSFNKIYKPGGESEMLEEEEFCDTEQCNDDELTAISEHRELECIAQVEEDIELSTKIIEKLTISQMNNYNLLEESLSSSDKSHCKVSDQESIGIEEVKSIEEDHDSDERFDHMLDDLDFGLSNNNIIPCSTGLEEQDQVEITSLPECSVTELDEEKMSKELVPFSTTTSVFDENADIDQNSKELKLFLKQLANKYPGIVGEEEIPAKNEAEEITTNSTNPFLKIISQQVESVKNKKQTEEDIVPSPKNPFLSTERDEVGNCSATTIWEKKLDSWISKPETRKLNEEAPPFIPSAKAVPNRGLANYGQPSHYPTNPAPLPYPAYSRYPANYHYHPQNHPYYPPNQPCPPNPPYNPFGPGYNMTPYGSYPQYPQWSNAGYTPSFYGGVPLNCEPGPSYMNQPQQPQKRDGPKSALRPPPGFSPHPPAQGPVLELLRVSMPQGSDFYERFNEMMRLKNGGSLQK